MIAQIGPKNADMKLSLTVYLYARPEIQERLHYALAAYFRKWLPSRPHWNVLETTYRHRGSRHGEPEYCRLKVEFECNTKLEKFSEPKALGIFEFFISKVEYLVHSPYFRKGVGLEKDSRVIAWDVKPILMPDGIEVSGVWQSGSLRKPLVRPAERINRAIHHLLAVMVKEVKESAKKHRDCGDAAVFECIELELLELSSRLLLFAECTCLLLDKDGADDVRGPAVDDCLRQIAELRSITRTLLHLLGSQSGSTRRRLWYWGRRDVFKPIWLFCYWYLDKFPGSQHRKNIPVELRNEAIWNLNSLSRWYGLISGHIRLQDPDGGRRLRSAVSLADDGPEKLDLLGLFGLKPEMLTDVERLKPKFKKLQRSIEEQSRPVLAALQDIAKLPHRGSQAAPRRRWFGLRKGKPTEEHHCLLLRKSTSFWKDIDEDVMTELESEMGDEKLQEKWEKE
ncbi:hypothetical protein VTK73DRAFT_5400 [Phialemonium thermophilum]|uniref:Uncharacterized protein n=1 Tax=Phialemonium thermophilum TaxID=223376 RepID=A0ABR3XY56_9PEZI